MIHVDEGTLQAWMDGELSGVARAETEAHVASCPACAATAHTLRVLSARAHEALMLLGDAPEATPVLAAGIRHGARSGRLRVRAIPAGLLRAAAVVLIFGGVVAAAIPGSPLRRWIESSLRDETPAVPTVDTTSPPPVVEAPPRIEPVQETGASIQPADGILLIRLQDVGPDTEVMVRVVDENVAWARWSASNIEVRQRSGAGRLEISNVGPGLMTILVPRSARSAIVEVDGSVWWTLENGRIRILGPQPERSGDEVVFHQR
jgi:hypothetical protein